MYDEFFFESLHIQIADEHLVSVRVSRILWINECCCEASQGFLIGSRRSHARFAGSSHPFGTFNQENSCQ